jgi:hypothetical protein
MDSSLRLRIWTARRRHSTTQCALESRMVNFDRFAITDISASPSCLYWQRQYSITPLDYPCRRQHP